MQQLIVALLVTAAALVSTWKLLPARRRLRLLLAIDAWLAQRDLLGRWREHSLRARIRSAAGSGCAGCAANAGLHPPKH